MADESEEHGDPRSAVGADLVIPIAAIALAIYYFTTIMDSPWTAKVTAYVVGIVLIGLALFHIARSLLGVVRGTSRLSFSRLIEPVPLLPTRVALFALTLGSIIVIPWIGFTLTAILFLFFATALLTRGRNLRGIAALAIGLSLTWFIVFVLIFKRRFPLGWLDHQIKDLFLPLLQSLGLD